MPMPMPQCTSDISCMERFCPSHPLIRLRFQLMREDGRRIGVLGVEHDAANERWCVDADTTPTTALNSRTSLQGDLRRHCHTSLQGVDYWRTRHQGAYIGGYDIRGHTLRPRSNEQSSVNDHRRTVVKGTIVYEWSSTATDMGEMDNYLRMKIMNNYRYRI